MNDYSNNTPLCARPKPLPENYELPSVDLLHPKSCYERADEVKTRVDRTRKRGNRGQQFLAALCKNMSPNVQSNSSSQGKARDFEIRNGSSMAQTFDEERRSPEIRQRKSTSSQNSELGPGNFTFFAQNATLHGLSHIFQQGRWSLRRMLWGLFFFTSLGLFLLQAENRYSYYMSHPHVTKLDELDVKILTFPAITICNINSFRLSKITTDDFFRLGRPIFMMFDENYRLTDENFKKRADYQLVADRLKPILDQGCDYKPENKTFNIFEFYKRTGPDFTEMILECSYKGEPCLERRYWKEVYTRYGKCYTFNSGDKSATLNTSKGGVDNGIEMILNVQQDQYVPVWALNDEISIEAGFKVQIHHQTEPPFIRELGFGVAPGYQTLVATQEQRITFLPDPWGECIKSGLDVTQPFYYTDYSISGCRISCETNFVTDKCKCRMIHMPNNSSFPFCDPEQYSACADKALDYLLKKDETTCSCKTPCEVIRYNVESSVLQLTSRRSNGFLAWKYNVSKAYVKENFLKLNIFFEALNYETIDQKAAYELAGLLGDIGGQMGLFIGASILTILELFEFSYDVLKDKTWGRWSRRRTKDHGKNSALAAIRALFGKQKTKISGDVDLPHRVDEVFHSVPAALPALTEHCVRAKSPISRHRRFPETWDLPCHSLPRKANFDFINDPIRYQPLRHAGDSIFPPPPREYLEQHFPIIEYGLENLRCHFQDGRNELRHVDDENTAAEFGDGVDCYRCNAYVPNETTTLPHGRGVRREYTRIVSNEKKNCRFDFSRDTNAQYFAPPSKIPGSEILETDIH